MQSGLDVLLSERSALVRGRRVGLLAHPSSITSEFVHASDALLQCGSRLMMLLGPEHGVQGAAQDMVPIEERLDGHIPVHSLYGTTVESLSPRVEWLEGLDLLVIDLQDVGARYYTYIWTAVLALQVCARAEVPVLVLDRPNPLGGEVIEGPGIDPSYLSFVGLHNVPVRHGLTIAEMLRLVCAEQQIDVELDVVELKGWNRAMFFDQTQLPWVLPSPNMPTLDSAIVYGGMCLLEGTNLSEGRGTTRPFEIFGAPWLNGRTLAAALTEQTLPGVTFRALEFVPTFQKHCGEVCGGVQLHLNDRHAFHSFATGVVVLQTIQRHWAAEFDWRRSPYEFVDDRLAIDLLAGGPWLRERFDRYCDPCHWRDFAQSWKAAEVEFAQRREAFLLYR